MSVRPYAAPFSNRNSINAISAHNSLSESETENRPIKEERYNAVKKHKITITLTSALGDSIHFPLTSSSFGMQNLDKNIPRANRDFVPRKFEGMDSVELIRKKLNEDFYPTNVPRVVLCGLDGFGKTQIAINYINDESVKKNYFLRLWIKADSRKNLIAQYYSFARELGCLSKGMKEKEVIDEVKAWLSSAKTSEYWLMIFDDLKDPKLLDEFIPSSGGHLLVSSNNLGWANCSEKETILVHKMNDEEASELLFIGKEKNEIDEAKEILQKVGNLPFLIDKIRNFTHGKMTFKQYLSDYGDSFIVKNDNEEVEIAKSCKPLWEKILNIISKENKNAINILVYCSYLNGDNIPREILKESLRCGQKDGINERNFNSAESKLIDYGLLSKNLDEDSIYIHPALQAVIKDGKYNDKKILKKLCHYLSKKSDGAFSSTKPEDLSAWIPHMEYIIDNNYKEKRPKNKHTRQYLQKIALYLGVYYGSILHIEYEKQYLERGLFFVKDKERKTGDSLLIKILLADNKRKSGDTSAALKELGQIWDDQRRTNSKMNDTVAIINILLGLSYHDQGKLTEACKHIETGVNYLENEKPPHFIFISGILNLGFIYIKQDEKRLLKEASRYFAKAGQFFQAYHPVPHLSHALINFLQEITDSALNDTDTDAVVQNNIIKLKKDFPMAWDYIDMKANIMEKLSQINLQEPGEESADKLLDSDKDAPESSGLSPFFITQHNPRDEELLRVPIVNTLSASG